MIINKFCSIVLYESPGAYLKQAFSQKSSVYCTLVIAQHFQKEIQKEKKIFCWTEERWNHWQYKSKYQERPQYWICSRILKIPSHKLSKHNGASDILPKDSWVDIFSVFHSEVSWEHELYESDTFNYIQCHLKEDKFQPILEHMEYCFANAIHQNLQAVLPD